MDFNPIVPRVMHIDLNSCFATVEQQANPLYRGRPLVVAAYTTDRGCILAASVEAKRLGIKTGMRVFEGKNIYPRLIILPSDPPKYRFVNRKLLALLQTYRADIEVKSIDEMVMKFQEGNLLSLAKEIKVRIKREIGDWLTVSVGISTNRYLAKIASGLHKPDGLDIIDKTNIEETLSRLQLEDLCGIKKGNGSRLRRQGITTCLAMYHASSATLKTALASKTGHDWWLWLHGWESSLYDAGETKTIGHSYALQKAYATTDPRLHQILCQLVEKMGRRIREGGYCAMGMHVSCLFTDYTCWNHGEKLSHQVCTNPDLYREAKRILLKAPEKEVRLLAVNVFRLDPLAREQLRFFDSSDKKRVLAHALDTIADRWGEFTVFPARMLAMEQKVLDRIAFGSVPRSR